MKIRWNLYVILSMMLVASSIGGCRTNPAEAIPASRLLGTATAPAETTAHDAAPGKIDPESTPEPTRTAQPRPTRQSPEQITRRIHRPVR